MAKNQQFLTLFDRQQIEFFLRQGLKSPAIAEKIKKDRTVVWREINRNKGDHTPYVAAAANYYARRRASKTDRRKLLKHPQLLEHVKEMLIEGWSPEQIAGRLKKYPLSQVGSLTISHEAIYGYIYDEEPYLYHQLRRKHYERRPFGQRHAHKPAIPNRVPISARPKEINEKQTIGHFESDSIVGKQHQQGLSVQYERVIQLVKIHRIKNFKPEETNVAINETLASLPDGLVQSLTLDNGLENYQHQSWNIPTFFCEPYKSYQKPGVENINGLIRQYVPKGTDIRKVTDEQIKLYERRLNNRPRKKLNYQTPLEALTEYQRNVALKT